MDNKEIVLKILDEMAKMEDIKKIGVEYEGGEIIDFLPYFQKELKKYDKFIDAKYLIRILEMIKVNPEIPTNIKAVIEKIFSYMDLRDQNYRWGDCECGNCKKGRLKEKLEAMGFDVIFLEDKNDKKIK